MPLLPPFIEALHRWSMIYSRDNLKTPPPNQDLDGAQNKKKKKAQKIGLSINRNRLLKTVPSSLQKNYRQSIQETKARILQI